MCISLASIGEYCGNKSGGIAALYVVRIKDITSIPAPGVDGVTIASDIVLKSGKTWAKWDFALDSGGWEEPAEGDPGYETYKPKASVFIPGRSAGMVKKLDDAIGQRVIALMVDNAGKKILLGTAIIKAYDANDAETGRTIDFNRGLQVLPKYAGGNKPGDPMGYTVELTNAGMSSAAPFYNGAFTVG